MVRIQELDNLDDDDNNVATTETETMATNNADPDFNASVDAARAAMQPTPIEKFMAICKSLILRAMVIYFVMSFIRGGGNKIAPATPSTGGIKPVAMENSFPNGTVFDMYVYVNEHASSLDYINDQLLWKQEGMIYGDWLENENGYVSMTTQFTLGEKSRRNGSLFLHTVIVPIGDDPSNDANTKRIYLNKMLNKFKKKKIVKLRNLLSSGDEVAEKPTVAEIVSHYHPNLTINLVTDWTLWTPGAVPAPLNQFVNFVGDKYQPVVFYNDYWNLAKDYHPVGVENRTLQITLTYQPLSLFKWQLYAAQQMKSQWSVSTAFGGEEDLDDSEQDTLKEAMIDTNPILLVLTFVVSLLHSVFEFLAFKNDIQFWNNRKDLEGLSVRSVFFNVFQSTIVLLYVLDNETNWVIRISCFVGLGIEIWKIHKVTDITFSPTDRIIFGLFPRPILLEKPSYSTTVTKSYDKLAFHYLGILCFPLLILYGIYSLIYQEHKGIYSFILSLAYGFLLTFGFIMMTPQLFINYKLKSVAHLPWRMLTYKFLNTFIDDIFAFVIKMPWMYRIGCLRDDVVFFVFLWQRWVYKTDFERVNEFGYRERREESGVEGGEEVKEITEGKKDQ
ncbi:cleft lip and palate transmembrane protein 1 homolog [Folsomia candida]|nr:cleft lip and palate transmembrane protein 1 homolog [Folsomia candida]